MRSGRSATAALTPSLAIFGFNYFETHARQKIAQDLQVVLLIFDHQNALCHAGLACPSTVTGSVNAKVEPLPGLDSTQMRPPCISMIRFEMARPSPVPPFFRVIELSAC